MAQGKKTKKIKYGPNMGKYPDEELEPTTKAGKELVCGDDSLKDVDTDVDPGEEAYIEEFYLDLTQ